MKRRLVTILAVMALGVSALAGAAPAAAADVPPGAVYVALGDSEAAGTGNLPYVDSDCLRSKKSYPMLLAGAFGGVASSACAGATTHDVLATQLGDLGLATRLVTLTAGVNNADWQGALIACSSGGSAQACDDAVKAALIAWATLPQDIAQVLLSIRTAAPAAQILVTGYPLLFGTVTDSCSVGAFQGTPVKFTAAQTQAINTAIAGINGLIQAGVAGYAGATGDPGVSYVDVTAGFAGHGLCDTGDRWISGLVSGKATFDRSFHANSPGQAALAQIVAGSIGG